MAPAGVNMTAIIIAVGLLAILGGLFLSKRSDQTGLGLGHQDCVDPMPPALDGLPTSQSFFVQMDQLLFHSGEVRL